MHHVQDFKSNFSPPAQERMAADNVAETPAAGVEIHEADSHVRNVCFVWADGRKAFFNYAYLMAGEFEPNSDKNLIKLNFSSQSVILHGYSLEMLFKMLIDHLPRIIKATDIRYVLDSAPKNPVVIQIIIERKDQ